MSILKLSVFPTKSEANGSFVLIKNMRIIREDPPRIRLFERMNGIKDFGHRLIDPNREVIFNQINDEKPTISYPIMAYPIEAQDFRGSLLAISDLGQEDIAIQACYALQRAVGHTTDKKLRDLREEAFLLFPLEADGDVEVAHTSARRSQRSHGQHRHTLYIAELILLFSGITGVDHAFENVTDIQLLGMCTMIHHILFQSRVRPHVGPKVTHGLGILSQGGAGSPAGVSGRYPLMVGLQSQTGIINTQVRNGLGVVYAPYAINRWDVAAPGSSNCCLEEEHSSNDITISFGFWNPPDFPVRLNSGVSVIVVYATKRIPVGTELLWEYEALPTVLAAPPPPPSPPAESGRKRAASPGY
jgi:hypothetical protein